MRLIGLMPVRNEAWCLGLTARAALMWCDALILGFHNCSDASTEIALEIGKEHGTRLIGWNQFGGDWNEMQHRQCLLDVARGAGATHIAIVDADEILTGNLLGPNHAMTGLASGQIIALPGYNLRGGLDRYHANGIWGNRWFSVAFKDDERLYWGGDNFHHREPRGMTLQPYKPIAQGEGGVMHLWGVSERRLKAKHALYKLNERLRWPDKPVAEIDRMYSWAIHGDPGNRSFGTPDTWTYAEVPASWWAPYSHLMQYLDVDAEPWQELECTQLILEHPRLAAGLDLFGVV